MRCFGRLACRPVKTKLTSSRQTHRPTAIERAASRRECRHGSRYARAAKILALCLAFHVMTPSPMYGQFAAPATVAPVVVNPPAPGVGRQIRIVPRSSVPLNFSWFPSPDGSERIAVIDSGANIVIGGVPSFGTVDIATDRLVIWTNGNAEQLSLSGDSGQAPADVPLEFYMEGNIVFRSGERVIYANSMYYDVRNERGVVLDAELLSQVPRYAGLVRLKADVLQQLDRNRFQAYDAAFTSSRLGLPQYWFQAEQLSFQDFPAPIVDPVSGLPVIDPQTGLPAIAHQRKAESHNNFVYVGGVPIFYWPKISTDLTNPRTFIRRVRFGQDNVFGTQFGLSVDAKQLLGISERAPGVDWTAGFDYLSKRGWGVGTTVDYEVERFLGLNGPTIGFFDAWAIHDDGLDNLGADRRALVPEKTDRGRAFWQHRQRLPNGLQITAELGVISDRNFLEQYYEVEWDEWKDQSTGIELKWLGGSSSWNLATDFRVNDFFTETEWFPRLDHFQLGQSLLQDRLTWYGHSQIGYARMRAADRPTDPVDLAKFNPLAWEANVEGVRVGGRHEIDLPFQIGAVKVVPFALGEVMHWGQDLNRDSTTRYLGQAGARASLPIWRVDPGRQSTLWNLNGLAHKVVFETEFLWADASENLEDLPLYDPLDDNSIEHFRRRFVDDDFGGLPNVDDLVPAQFDERFYALRYGMQRWVTGPTEIADDLLLLRLGARQRWQTKRGLPGNQRVIDWMTLDSHVSLFPKEDRDNFGEVAGLLSYDWRWYVGDRLTIMSDGYADTFDDALRVFTLGGHMTRPERGSLYLGFRSIEGPISSNLLLSSVKYRMSEKWIAMIGSAIDLGPAGNIGQRFELTRIGESFLVTVGANIDVSRDNVGFNFAVEPRFLNFTRRGIVGGVPIPPAGARGLE
jgi:hypothetical protein